MGEKSESKKDDTGVGKMTSKGKQKTIQKPLMNKKKRGSSEKGLLEKVIVT